MSLIKNLLVCIGLWAAFGLTPASAETNKAETLKILTLGDSRVEGARSHFESYRFELWKLLVQNNWRVDFIGPLEDEARYPTVMGQRFDPDHARVGGFTTIDVLEHLEGALDEIAIPDIVLVGIGGNDLLGTRSPVPRVLENLRKIVGILQARNQHALILVEQIAPGKRSVMRREFQARFDAFNAEIPALAASLSTESSRVVAVDMRPNWSEAYLADDVHYNETGARHVAEHYFTALKQEVGQVTE